MDVIKENSQSNAHTYIRNPSNHGITLIEMMLIVMLLAILAAVFIRIYLNETEHPRLDKKEQAILTIENGMRFYKLDNGFYPTTAQGISALTIKPTTKPTPQHWIKYLDTIPVDQWGKPYHYANPGKHSDIDIYSEGPGK